MKFRVTVRKEDGVEEKRSIEAASRFEVYSNAEKEGVTVVQVEEGSGGFTLPKWANIKLSSGINQEQKITFTKNLSAMLKAGLTLSRALSVIERQSANKFLKEVVVDLESEVKKGTAFNEALAKHSSIFSKLFIAMTRAGEESGTLADALGVVARQMDRSYTLQKKIKGAMIYPTIIMVAVIVIGVLMLIYVVPTLSATFVSLRVELPSSTKAVIAASDFMASHVILTFGILGAFLAGMFFLLRSKPGSAALLYVSLHVPVIGDLVRETMSARAARALSSLLSSGVEMLSAIAIAEEVVGDNIFGKVVHEAQDKVRKGEALSTVFAAHPKLYPVLVGDMIAVGEETGNVSSMLGQVAEYYETDVEDRTKDLSTIIEPLLMLFIGSVVGLFAISMISPIYSLSSSIN
ncbi:MAG: general secretion pathway protein F [Parcubacteria bacterium C7867-001]|nr:MAG: general secretion pathway protein F [Parcubacteria bacterium C7867-001]